MIRKAIGSFLLVFVILNSVSAQDKSVEEFIISVTSNYKNPLAYYPLRQDIFLPTEIEAEQLERSKDRPKNSTVTGSFIFMDKDADLNRDRFLTASGDLMFTNSVYKGLSKSSTYKYHKRRQKLISDRYKNIGRFLWYNQQFKALR